MWNVCRAASKYQQKIVERVFWCVTTAVIIKQHVKIFMVENITAPHLSSADRRDPKRRVATKKSAGLCEGEGNREGGAETAGRKEKHQPAL